MKPLIAPLQAIEGRLRVEYERKLAAYELLRSAYETKQKAALRGGSVGLAGDCTAALEAPPVKPVQRRFIVNEATVEG